MIEGLHKKKNVNYEKSGLYIIQSSETIEFVEKSGDHVTILYKINRGQQGLYAQEFRPQQVHKQNAKVIDLSMGIEDYTNKKIVWGLYDLKHTLGGIDDAMRLGEQWQDALRYWYNCVLNYLDDYTKIGEIGVVTTKDETYKIKEYVERLRRELADSQKLIGTLAGLKNEAANIRKKEELDFFEKFLKKEFVYLDPNGKKEIWQIRVIISEHHVFEWGYIKENKPDNTKL